MPSSSNAYADFYDACASCGRALKCYSQNVAVRDSRCREPLPGFMRGPRALQRPVQESWAHLIFASVFSAASSSQIGALSLIAFARIAVHQCTLSRVQQGCGSPGVGSQELRRAQCCHLLQTAVQVKSEFEARRPRDGLTQRARPRRAAAAPPPHRSKAYATVVAQHRTQCVVKRRRHGVHPALGRLRGRGREEALLESTESEGAERPRLLDACYLCEAPPLVCRRRLVALRGS